MPSSAAANAATGSFLVEAGNVEDQSAVLVVQPVRQSALRNGGPVGGRGGGRRAAAGQVPRHRSVRVAVSLRDHVRVVVRWRRPGPARDRAVHFRFQLLFLAADVFGRGGVQGPAAPAPVRDHGSVCGGVERGAKAHRRLARAHARRPADGGPRARKTSTHRCKSRIPNEGEPSRPFVTPSGSCN